MLGMLISMAVMFGALIMLPVIAVGVVLKLGMALLLLPFKILGLVVHVVFSVVGAVFKAVFSVVGGLAFLVMGFLFLVALPLFPLLLFGAFVWAVAKAFSPTPTLRTI
jgi:hypothetical protein